jgi:hypothetical protein
MCQPDRRLCDIRHAETHSAQNGLEVLQRTVRGSWLNIAEIELAVLAGQCPNRRLPDIETMRQEIAAWERDRSAISTGVNWRFTTADARIKLKQLYPAHQ